MVVMTVTQTVDANAGDDCHGFPPRENDILSFLRVRGRNAVLGACHDISVAEHLSVIAVTLDAYERLMIYLLCDEPLAMGGPCVTPFLPPKGDSIG